MGRVKVDYEKVEEGLNDVNNTLYNIERLVHMQYDGDNKGLISDVRTQVVNLQNLLVNGELGIPKKKSLTEVKRDLHNFEVHLGSVIGHLSEAKKIAGDYDRDVMAVLANKQEEMTDIKRSFQSGQLGTMPTIEELEDCPDNKDNK